MKLASIGSVVVMVSVAHADAAFDEYARGVAQRPARQLYEASCDLDVEVRGAVASVELRQRIVNPGPDEMAASYEAELPRGAQVVGFSLRGDGRVEPALPVDRASPSIASGTPGVTGPDPALLVRDRDAGYHVIVQPIAPEREVVLTTRYVALAEPRGGALRLVLPGRAVNGKLAPCRGTIRANPGPGATVRRIRAGKLDSPGGRGVAFVLDAQGTTIEVDLTIPGQAPLVWAQTQPLADGWQASLITVLGPRLMTPPGPRRVVFLIDGSRSMDLVGRHNVIKVVNRLGAALPVDAELDAIIYDRKPSRVFGELRPATAANLATIEAAVHDRAAVNGSDLVGAFELAKQAIAGPRGPAMLVVITDGVTGDVDAAAVSRALAETTGVAVHAIVLDPATTTSPGAFALRAPVNRYGGAYVEVAVDELDDALGAADDWLRPSWLELRLGDHPVPTEVRAGGGFARTFVHRGAARFTLTGHGQRPIAVAARAAANAPIASIALAEARLVDFTGSPDPSDAELERARSTFERAVAAQPFAGAATRSFAVLATAGKIARNRRAVVAGGGRYERVIALADPMTNLAAAPGPPRPVASAIARPTLERLFRDQLQPRAYACYQRALGRNARLMGMVRFQFRLGRGEVTEVSVNGLGDAQLDACLLDAGYQLTPPLPDFTLNADDQTIANYPLTFNRRDDQTVVVLGDADSASPLDIDAIQGGVPADRRRPIKLDPTITNTPLGGLRPSTSP